MACKTCGKMKCACGGMATKKAKGGMVLMMKKGKGGMMKKGKKGC